MDEKVINIEVFKEILVFKILVLFKILLYFMSGFVFGIVCYICVDMVFFVGIFLVIFLLIFIYFN